MEYSSRQLKDLLCMIDEGNRTKQQQKGGGGMKKVMSAFALVGMFITNFPSYW